MLQVLILDFDGVIVESNDVKTEAFRELFSRFPEHYEAMMAYHHAHISATRFVKFDHLLTLVGRVGDYGLQVDLAKDFSQLVSERMLHVPLVPGAESFLRTMTTRLPVYLASVTPAEELEWILRHLELGHWFRDVYGCPPWTKLKAIADVLDRERVTSEEVLFIGDSAGDQRVALETGIHFLARDSGLNFDNPMPLSFSDMNELGAHLAECLP